MGVFGYICRSNSSDDTNSTIFEITDRQSVEDSDQVCTQLTYKELKLIYLRYRLLPVF